MRTTRRRTARAVLVRTKLPLASEMTRLTEAPAESSSVTTAPGRGAAREESRTTPRTCCAPRCALIPATAMTASVENRIPCNLLPFPSG